jgi:hypothetical protein
MVTALAVAAAAAIALVGLVRAIEPSLAFFPLRGEDATPAAGTFEAVDLTTSDGESLRAWWMPHPEPRALVYYLHGNGGNLSMWLPVLSGIQQRGFSVFALDYRGYGTSTGRPSEQGLYRDVEAALARVSELASARVPIIYWGRSLGAVMAAFAASRRGPDGLILESGFPDARSVVAGSLLWPLSFLSSYRFPAGEWLQSVHCPTLVMHGTEDSVIPFRLGRQLFESVPGPKTFVAIEGGDHNDAQPPDPDSYWRAIVAFADKLH